MALSQKEKTDKLMIVQDYLAEVYERIKGHLEDPNPMIHNLNCYQLILGVTEVMYEDALEKEGKMSPKAIVIVEPEMPENNVTDLNKNKKQYH